MNCRAEEVKKVLLEKRMKRWLSILRCGFADKRSARARRNLVRLAVRHEAIARELGMTVAVIYSL